MRIGYARSIGTCDMCQLELRVGGVFMLTNHLAVLTVSAVNRPTAVLSDHLICMSCQASVVASGPVKTVALLQFPARFRSADVHPSTNV